MHRLLLTGGTGLIGRRVLERQAGRDLQIFALSRRAGPAHIAADLSGPFDTSAFPAEIDSVAHLAQSRNFRNFPEQAEEVFAVNASATLRLLEYARRAKAKRFVLASTGGVYAPSTSPLTEESPLWEAGKMSFYAWSKLAAERLAMQYQPYFSVIILRFFFVYGPGQDPGMLIPRIAASIEQGRSIKLQGAEGLRITPTYMDDAAAAVEKALEHNSHAIFNIAGNEILSLKDISLAIGKQIGKQPRFEASPDAIADLIADGAKSARVLHKPQTSFERGLQLCFGKPPAACKPG